jgi:hypothetical protein
MKKLALILSVAAAGSTMFASDASAQRIVVEAPGARLGLGDRGGDRRVGYDLDRLNREVRQLRVEIRRYEGGRRAVYRFERVQRAAERLSYEYDRRMSSPWQTRRRIEQVRAEISDIREDLRNRAERRGYGEDDRPRDRSYEGDRPRYR